MIRAFVASMALLVITACDSITSTQIGRPGDGTVVIRLSKVGADKIMFRHLDAVNAVRISNGLNPVDINAQLSEAARAHAVDMAAQNRPWHFGSDGSSPFDRVARAGFVGTFLGENVSETYEDDFNTLNVWMNNELSRAAILDNQANSMGLGWYQQSNGKIWWVQIFANRSGLF